MGIFLITGASGSGKTSIAHEIKKHGCWNECISHTTRPMRDGEKDGETYYFINRKTFEEKYKAGEFAERVEYHGNYYGISKHEIERVLSNGKNVFIIVEYNGYKQIKEIYPNAIGIFLYMSKEDCMINMLLRGDKLEKAQERITSYDEEVKNRGEYSYVIKNVRGKIEYTIGILKWIIKSYE